MGAPVQASKTVLTTGRDTRLQGGWPFAQRLRGRRYFLDSSEQGFVSSRSASGEVNVDYPERMKLRPTRGGYAEYYAMMFAKSPEQARMAAEKLVRHVLRTRRWHVQELPILIQSEFR